MKEVTMCCTTCPSGCALKVMIDNNEVVSVEGNNCPRGEKFAHKEDKSRTYADKYCICSN